MLMSETVKIAIGQKNVEEADRPAHVQTYLQIGCLHNVLFLKKLLEATDGTTYNRFLIQS